jgi:hypothetical protein
MFNKSVFFLLALTILFLLGCTKNDPEYYYIPEDFKQWVVYQPGTYWIYLNEQTGVVDCTYVTGVRNYQEVTGGNGSQETERHYEVITCDCSGSLYAKLSTRAQSESSRPINDRAILSIPICSPNMDDASFSYGLLLNPQFIKERRFEEISNYGVKQVYPQEDILGNQFINVYDLRHEWIDYNGDSLVTEAHFAKSTGIIKLRIYKEKFDTTWSLIRYKIVQ